MLSKQTVFIASGCHLAARDWRSASARINCAASAGGTRTTASRSACPHSVCSNKTNVFGRLKWGLKTPLCVATRVEAVTVPDQQAAVVCSKLTMSTSMSQEAHPQIGRQKRGSWRACGALVHSGSPPITLPPPDASFSTCACDTAKILGHLDYALGLCKGFRICGSPWPAEQKAGTLSEMMQHSAIALQDHTNLRNHRVDVLLDDHPPLQRAHRRTARPRKTGAAAMGPAARRGARGSGRATARWPS